MTQTFDSAFGLSARHHFKLEPRSVFVNHGSYGAVPDAVRSAQLDWRDRTEARPSFFYSGELPGLLRQAAGVVGNYLGAKGDDVVFTGNATDGTNAVLQSLQLAAGDEIVLHELTYDATKLAVERMVRRTGAVVRMVRVPVPWDGTDLPAAFLGAVSTRTRLVVLDHIVSSIGAEMPVQAISQAIRAGLPKRAAILVDGAHGPGQVDVDVAALGATWYTTNAHKWLCGPKGVGLLWAAPDAQEWTEPNIASLYADKGFNRSFDYPGTRDASGILALPSALKFREQIGGDAEIKRYCTALTSRASSFFSSEWKTPLAAPASAFHAMASIALPTTLDPTAENARALQARMWSEFRVDTKISALDGRLWLRISCALYNVDEDYARLSDAVIRCLKS
jgi:isopenicillin-N epimerase